MSESILTPTQRRAARAILGLSQAELGARAKVGRMTVKRWEDGEAVRPAQNALITRALEDAGVVVLTDIETKDGRLIDFAVGVATRAERNG